MKIDTHCHVMHEYYGDKLDNLIKTYDGILIINGYDGPSNKETIELCNKYSNVYGTIGIHPSEASKYKNDDLVFIKENLNNPKIVGIGEIGLDYYWEKENKSEQKILFGEQIKIANEFSLPIIVHSRDAIKDTYEIINDLYTANKAVIHSYSGSVEMAREFIKIGAKLGVNGVVTYKNAKNIKEVVMDTALEDLLIETDSPYLTPEPFRGKQNEPENTKYIVAKIAEIKNINQAEVTSVTTKTALTLFDIKL